MTTSLSRLCSDLARIAADPMGAWIRSYPCLGHPARRRRSLPHGSRPIHSRTSLNCSRDFRNSLLRSNLRHPTPTRRRERRTDRCLVGRGMPQTVPNRLSHARAAEKYPRLLSPLNTSRLSNGGSPRHWQLCWSRTTGVSREGLTQSETAFRPREVA